MRLLGLQFWFTVPPNCHSGLVIYFGEGPKSLSDFKKSQYRKVSEYSPDLRSQCRCASERNLSEDILLLVRQRKIHLSWQLNSFTSHVSILVSMICVGSGLQMEQTEFFLFFLHGKYHCTMIRESFYCLFYFRYKRLKYILLLQLAGKCTSTFPKVWEKFTKMVSFSALLNCWKYQYTQC